MPGFGIVAHSGGRRQLDDVKGKRSGKSTLLLSFEFTRLGGGGGGEGGGVDKA